SERERRRMKHHNERIGNLAGDAARVQLELAAKRLLVRDDAPMLDAKTGTVPVFQAARFLRTGGAKTGTVPVFRLACIAAAHAATIRSAPRSDNRGAPTPLS